MIAIYSNTQADARHYAAALKLPAASYRIFSTRAEGFIADEYHILPGIPKDLREHAVASARRGTAKLVDHGSW